MSSRDVQFSNKSGDFGVLLYELGECLECICVNDDFAEDDSPARCGERATNKRGCFESCEIIAQLAEYRVNDFLWDDR